MFQFFSDFELISLPIYFLVLIFGACVGSFLSVVIDRIPAGKGLSGRSRADCCGKTLGVLDLIPILSFAASFGRCRYCRRPLSFYYPLVELISAFLTAAAFFYFPFPFSLFYLVSFYFLIVFFFTDLKYGLVPLSVFLGGLCFVSVFEFYFFLGGFLTSYFLLFDWIFAIGAALFFVLLILITRGRGMGAGDALLVFLFSLILGFPKSVMMIFLSFILGGFVSGFLLLLKKKHFGQTLPFGPFMVLATLASIFYGRQLIGWYLALLVR